MNEEVLKKIWEDTSKSDSTFTADYDQFKSAMSMYPNFRNSIYDGIRERDKEVKATNQDWDNFLGFNSSVTTTIEEPKVNKSLRNEAYSDMSDDDLQGKYNDMLKKAEQRKKEAIEKAKLEQSKMSKERPLLYAFSQAGAQSSYGASAPNTIQAIEQSAAELFLDENDKNEYDSLHKEIGVRGYESGYEGIKKSTEEEENRVKNIRSNAELDGNKLTARDKSMLRKAEKINSDARELVEAGSKYGNESGIENWIDGLSNTLIDRDMITGVGLIRDMKVDNMVEKLNNGEELSEAEGALLLAAYNFEEVAKTRSFDLSTGYKIGQGTAESVPFILDMMLTKGLIGGGKKALLKFFASKGKDVAKLARVMDVSLDGSKVARATTGEKLLHGAYELGETAVQTAMMPSSQRQMMQEKTEIRKATGENDISLKDRARIFGNAYVQTFTERKGGEMIDWALGKMLPVGNLMARFGYKEGIVKSLNDVIQSPLSEVGEEYLGAAINLLRSIDLLNLYSEDSNDDMRDEALSIFSTDGLGEIVGSTLPISLLGGAVNATSIATSTNRFNKAHIAFAKKLEEAGATQTQAENILSKLESANSQDEFNERLDIARGFLKKHIQETETDLGIANTKMHEVDGLVDNYKESATTFNNAVKDLRTLYAQLPQEKKDAAKADFENMRRKINESITMTHPQEGPAVVSKRPTSGWQKRTMSVKIDGKNTKVTFSGDVVFNEDGSINTSLSNMDNFRLQNDKGQNIRTTVKGEDAKKRKFDIYLNAVNDALRKEKEKRDNEIAAQKAAEEARKAELKRIEEEEKKKVEEENAKLEAQKQAIAAQEADRQSIIAGFPMDKNGEVDIDKMSPEQFFVYESDTDTPEAAMNTVGDVLNDLYQQLEDNTNEANREKRARNAAKIKNRIRQYEAVVVKYAGQETLDAINASRIAPAAPVVESAPVEEVPAVPQEQAPAPAVESVAEPEPAQEVEQSATEEVSETKDAAIEENKTEEKVQKPSYDIETEVNDGTIKLLFSPNSKGQWYVLRNGEVISRSLNANRKKLPDNTREVADAKVKYIKTADDNYIPILLFSESTKNDTLKGEKQVMLQDGSVTIVKASEMFDKISENEYIPTQSNTTKKEAQRKERAKYSTFDAVLKYPVVNFSDGTVLTFADVLGLGFDKKKNSQYVTPYDRVIEMINTKESNEDVITGKKKAFREDYKKVAQYWNAVVDAKYEGNEKLKMAVDLSVGKHDTSGRVMASSMIAADNAIDLGLVSVIIEDKFLTIPTKWGGEKAETTWVKNMTDEEIVDKVTSLTDGLQDDIQKYTALEEKAKTIEEDKKAAEALSFEVDIKEMSEEELKDMETLGVSINKQQRAVRDFLKKLNESQLEMVGKSISPSQLYAKNIIKKYIDRIQKAGIKNQQASTKTEKEVAKGAAAATNSKNNVLQKVSAKRDSVKLIDNMTEQEALDIYKRYIQGNAPANMTAEQVASVIEMLKASKHGAAIEAEEARIKALQEEYLRSSQAEQEETTDTAEEKEQAQPETSEDTTETSTQNQTPVSVESLRADIEKLSAELERIDSLPNPTQEQLDRADAIFAELQKKNTQLENLGQGYKEEDSNKSLEKEIKDLEAKLSELSMEEEDEFDRINTLLQEKKSKLELLENNKFNSASRDLAFQIGDQVIEDETSTKRIIKILKAAGVRVITFKNEDLPKYVSQKKLEELSDGQIVYGFASSDTIYLNEDHLNPNSPLHEFTHLWVTAYKKAFPNEWKRFVDIANKSALAANLRKPLKNGNKNPYAKLSDDEMASEVLSRYTGYLYGELDADGRTAFENMIQAQTMEEKIAEKSLLNRIRNIWKKIISWFDKSIDNEKKEDIIDNMIRKFAQAPMETLARGREAVDELKQIANQGYKVQSVYHGTAAEFSQFDHDFMGSGEGAQAYGWGTYVSQVKDIAVSYAEKIAEYRRLDNPFDETIEHGLHELFEGYKKVYADFGASLTEYISTIKRQASSDVTNVKEEAYIYMPESELPTPAREIGAEEIIKYAVAFDKLLDDEAMIMNPVWDRWIIKKIIHELFEFAEIIKAAEEMSENDKNAFFSGLKWDKKNRHLYEVQIPADAYLEDGSIDLENSPYLGFDDDYAYNSRIHRMLVQHLSEEVDKLAKELSETPNPEFPALTLKEYVANGDWFYEEDMSYFSQELIDKLSDYFTSARTLRILTNLSGESGAGIYRIVEGFTGSPKAASEWLLSQGILGVRVSTGATSGKKRETKNYVIFNEADAHIVNHTAFMIGEDGKLMLNNTSENLDNSKKSSTFAENNENYERTDEFRELQERSNSLPESTIAEYHSEEREFSDEDRRRVGGVFQRLMESERNGGRNGQWINLTGKGNQFKIAQVNPAIFHDIFQICRNYLPNGELVDLHDNYADCKCFISEDGLCGFAIEPNGNLISVFSLNPSDKKGFLYAIKDLIRQEGATHLDCFVSNKQPLAEIYQKALGFHVASEMDYNMEYDHDNIAENHGMPKVAFMVDKPTEKREFDGESYDAAYDYQQSQTSTAEREQIIAEAKANGTFMTAPNGQPTNLTEDQWVATRTQAFKDYFGDWQNEPANASVVLDENGEPLVVYHGSRMAGFDKFGRGEARDSQGIYTTPNRRAAESYATSKEEWKSGQTMPEAELGVPDHHGVYSLFVNMRNPKVIDFGGKEFDRFGTPKYEVATNEAIDNGERGILFDTLEEAEAYIAEHPDEDLDYVEKYTTSDDLLVQAKEEGYDGVIFTNIIDSRYRDPITNYVPFEPNQVKSATQNVGTFNPEDDRIEFMIGPVINENQKEGIERASNKLVKGIAANVPLPERMKSAGELWSEIGDSGEVFRQILKSLREFNSKHGLSRKLSEGSDVRQIYTNSRTVLANKIKELKNLYENPLRKNFEELIEVVKSSSMYEKYKKEIRTVEKEVLQEDGTIKYELTQIEHELTPREFIERYLIACDNIERFQKNIPTRGLAVFKQWMGMDVMEFQIEFEAAFGASKEGEALLNSLWKSINDYTNYTLEDSFTCEMITQEEYYKRKDRKFYIPERDFAIDKDLDQPDVSPKKRYRSNKLSSSIKAKGGESLAANILENMIHIGNVDLQKNNKNRVKLAMWNLLQDNPEFRESIGLPKPYEVWYDKDGKRVTSTPTREEREHMRLVQEDILQLENLLEEELSKDEELQDKAEIDSLREELNKVYKERDSIPYLLEYEARNRFQSEGDPNVVGLYVNGTLCSMSFPNMSLAAIALNDTWDKAPRLWGPIRWIKGLWSSVITTLEPSFFLINTATDGLSIVLKGAIQYDIEFSLRYIATAKDILKNGRLVGSYVLGKDYRSLENGELFRDFLMNGGNTGYASVKNMEQILKDLEYLDREHSSLEEAMKQVKKSLSFMNECTELLLRFAAYKTAIDMGKGVEEAINASNNLSANFNRRGEAVPLGDTVTWHKKAFVNLMRHFKEFSMFFNPAVQGAMQFWRMFGESGALDSKEKAERWFKIFTNAMFLPALAGFINTMICEDDEEEEWSVSEYDRANYFIIGKNGKFPIGHMLRPFYNIGVNIALGMQGRRGAGDIADSIITSFLTHLTPCAPSLSNMGVKVVHNAFGGQELTLWDFLQSFTTPESLAVLNEAADGVNFMGQQVKYDDEKTAMYTKNPNAGTFEKLIAQLVFYAGGGEWGGTTTLKRNGEGDVHDMFNVTPNEVKTFLSLWMPKSILNTTNVVAGAIQNRIDESRGEYVNNNIKLKNVPFISSFISERTPEAYRSGIYSEANKISRANKLVMDKAYKEMVRISVQLQSEMTEEEYIKLERRYEHFESIYNQAASDVIADAIREILPAYKEARFSNLQKRFSMNEKELKKYMSDIDYDSLEENERELIFNLSQLVQMKEGCGPVNSKIPQWMKGVFKMEPTSAEVQELWDTYEEYIEE